MRDKVVNISTKRVDPVLAELQADCPDHLISRQYDSWYGWVYLARRIDGREGPLLVMAEDAEKLREHLGVTR